MDLLSRFALADIQMAERHREERTLTLRHEAAERRRAGTAHAVRAPEPLACPSRTGSRLCSVARPIPLLHVRLTR